MHTAGRSSSILLAEDELTIAVPLCDDLVEHGFEVEHVADGTTAIERLERRRFDAVICDLRLPGVDGLTVLRHAASRAASAPRLLITAWLPAAGEIALRATDTCLLRKPFANDAVLAWLFAMVRSSEDVVVPDVPKQGARVTDR